LKECFDGVNVKLDKSGGVLEAYRMLQIAKALGMKTMLGCMISSSVTVTAAAHLSPLVDYADLDGNLLISNDPFHGVRVEKGKLVLPKGAGLGLTAAKDRCRCRCFSPWLQAGRFRMEPEYDLAGVLVQRRMENW